jgi:hypothetical protein
MPECGPPCAIRIGVEQKPDCASAIDELGGLTNGGQYEGGHRAASLENHGAASHRFGYYHSGVHAGQILIAVGYPDMATHE